MKKYIAAIALTVSLGATAATPTFAQVEAAMINKDYAVAKVLMDEILRKRPESIRAHALNASLILAAGGDKEEVEAELAYVNKLKTQTVQPISPAPEQSNIVKYTITGLCVIAAIIASFLVGAYVKLRTRNKRKVDEDAGEDIPDIDRSNYSTTLTNHGV